MTRISRTIFTLAALLPAAPALAQGDTNADIRAVAAAFDAAQQKGDRAALDRLLAPDFLFARSDGRIGNRQDFIDGFTAPGHALEPYRVTDPLFLRASGDVAIVGGEAWLKGVDRGKPFTQHFRYSNTLAKRAGRWVVIYEQVTGLPLD